MYRLALILPSLLLIPQESSAPDWGRRIQWSEDAAPASREHAALIPDPARQRAVMIGGSGYRPYGEPLADAWAFDYVDESWSQLKVVGDELVPGGSRRAATVETGAYLHGGYTAGFAPVGEMWHVTLAADELVLSFVEQENPPPARLLHAFACDPTGEHFVVFGGGGDEDAFDDTWIGRRTDFGVRWRQLEGELNPGKRFGFAYAHDIQGGRLLVSGGQVPPGEGQEGMITARDLWALDFTAKKPVWTLLAEYDAETFQGRRNPAWAFDDVSGDLFVWGGTSNGANALPDLYVIRTRHKGAPVERLSQPDAIPTRCSGFGVIDRARGRALLGFGNVGSGPYDDLVEVKLR